MIEKHRKNREQVEIFSIEEFVPANHLLRKIDSAGYLSPEVVFVDGTHIKENANLKKAVKKAVPKAAKTYEKQLMEEINEDRESHDKKPFDETKPPKGG